MVGTGINMSTDNVITLLRLSNEDAKRYVKETARISSRVFFTSHAKERMSERDITRKQVLECLLRFRFIEEPHRTPNGNWKMTVEAQSMDDWITVALCLDNDSKGNYVLIITVI